MDLDFAKILDNVTLPLCISEGEKPNNLVYVNKAFCELTGYSAEELLGKNPGELLQKNLSSSKREYMREKLDRHESIDVLVKNFRKDNSEFWNGLHIHPVILLKHPPPALIRERSCHFYPQPPTNPCL